VSKPSVSQLKPLALRLPPLRRLVEQRDELLREQDELERRIADLELQLDRAWSRAQDLEDRQHDYLFVLTYGRSGSTLLQGILNTIPGYLIRGENHGVLHQYFRLHGKLAAKRNRVGPLVATNQERDAWFGIDGYDDETAAAAIRTLMLRTVIRPTPESRVVGYKEIRYQQKALGTYVAFMRSVFPDARFIVNTRDLARVAQSKWWARDPDALKKLTAIEGRLLAVAGDLQQDAFRVHYDDYQDDPGALRGLFDWLGEEFDERRVASVMANPHSY
jgi:hypothetical protein